MMNDNISRRLETGRQASGARGMNLNFEMREGDGDREYTDVVTQITRPVLEQWKPDILVGSRSARRLLNLRHGSVVAMWFRCARPFTVTIQVPGAGDGLSLVTRLVSRLSYSGRRDVPLSSGMDGCIHMWPPASTTVK